MNKCKEALEHFETLFTDNSYYKQFDNSFVPFNEDKEALYELINKEEKYRWHDLRKDPNDLPTEPGRKYIITQCGNEKYIVAEWDGMYFGDWSTLFSEDNMIFTPYALVDKWKEIEEFEDE